jgi:hypothetical protein
VRKISLFPFFLLFNNFVLFIPIEYVPNVAASRGVYRSSYVRPTGGYGYRRPLPPPVVPAGRGPGGAGLLAAILGPIGGLTGCLCCLNTIGVWGLFITAIPLTVFISKFICLLNYILITLNFSIQGRWLAAFKNRSGLNGAGELFASQMLLLLLLVCSFLFTFMRRS